MKYIVYIWFIVSVCLFADMEEPQRDYLSKQNLVDYNVMSDKKVACIISKKHQKFCYEEMISYPDIKSIDDTNIANLIKQDIINIKNNFQKEDIKKDFDDMMDGFSSEWYRYESYDIFAFTPKTLTIMYDTSSYMGGAHGNYEREFINIDRITQKKLQLKDILKPNQEDDFERYVEQFYRQLRGISKDASMQEVGWFEDDFKLSDNFAITPKGLYFYYNSYEIQAYSFGTEVILLPYRKIKRFLSLNYFDDKTLNKIDDIAHHYKRVFNDSLQIEVKKVNKESIKVNIIATNTMFSTVQGWLSVGFTELSAKHPKVKLLNKDFDTFKVYPSHSSIYHKVKKKNIKSKYLLVEALSNKWQGNDTSKKLSFELKVPKDTQKLTILLRVVFKKGKRFFELDKEDEDNAIIKGQQGYDNYYIEITK